MAGQGRITDSVGRTSNFNGYNDTSNNSALSQGRPTSSLEYNGGNFMPMLFQPSPPRSPMGMSVNPPYGSNSFTTHNLGFGVVRPCNHLTIPSSCVTNPFGSSQMGNIAIDNSTPNLFLEEPSFRNVNMAEPQVYEPSIMAPTHQLYNSYQSEAYNYMDYVYNNDHHNSITPYGSIGGDYFPHFHTHLTTRGNVPSNEQTARNHAAGVMGDLFDGTRRTNQQPALPRANVNANYEQQSSQLPNSLVSLRNFLAEIRDDLQRTMENLATLEHYHPPPPLFEGIPIEDGDYDDEDDDSNMEEDDDGDDNDDDDGNDDAEVEGNEEAAGNANPGPLAENNVAMQEEENEAMQEEENDGVEVEDILAGLGSQVYDPPLDDTQPPSCSICLEEFKQGGLLGILDCHHMYHYTCIGEWLLLKNSCPLCRVVAI